MPQNSIPGRHYCPNCKRDKIHLELRATLADGSQSYRGQCLNCQSTWALLKDKRNKWQNYTIEKISGSDSDIPF